MVQAIREMKARGLRVTFYPFILMDVPPGNACRTLFRQRRHARSARFPMARPDHLFPGGGLCGTVDKTAAAATQVAALARGARPASASPATVSSGPVPGDWGLRRMILHYAHLCAVAGGVDAFLIGTEMPGLTTIRSGAGTYPAVTGYQGPGLRM